jgi:probable rRNA maturation factor
MPNQDNGFRPPTESNSEEAAEPPLIVSVANQTECSIDVDRVTRAAELAMAGSPYVAGEISIAVVDDRSIHELNRQFLDHDYPTDVLSFPLVAAGNHLEGEIVVSVDTAAREAAEVGWSTEDELLLYVVHGALHLAGFADKDPAMPSG